MPSLVALVLALAKALPLLERLLTAIETQRANARAAELHHAIDDAIATARSQASVCPRPDCPVFRRRLGELPAGPEPDRALPPAP